MHLRNSILLLVVALVSRVGFSDEAKLPFVHPLFADHMVLQRDRVVSVWGWTQPESTVSVSMAGRTAMSVAGDDGRWLVRAGPFSAGGPHRMEIRGSEESVEIRDVLVGEVWICSGQSNMEWPVRASRDAESEIAAADHPQIRLFTVPKRIASTPQKTVAGRWSVCHPETIPGFSAVAYSFGRRLQRELDVPIGLVHTSWGGTVAEAWTSAEALRRMSDFASAVDEFQRTVAEEAEGRESYATRVAKWWQENDKGTRSGWAKAELDSASWAEMDLPTNWESALPELREFDGVIWFRRTLDVPESWSGKEAVLHLGPIDDVDTTWINGQRLGGENDWRKPRIYRVAADQLRVGRNVVAVRVLDHQGGGGLHGRPGQMRLELREDAASRVALAGAWRYRVGAAKKDLSAFPQQLGRNPNFVTVLYNGMLAPLAPYGIRGAIWYQGESNAGRAAQYRRLLPAMIKDWRHAFGQGDFPFLVVQLANFMKRQEAPVESGWAELREAQLMTAERDPNVGLAVITDIGEANDIHPRNKQDVGKRLALSALKIAYRKNDVVHSGPTFKAYAIEGRGLRITFANVGKGLVAKGNDGKLTGFALAEAGSERFVWANARIEGDSVLLWSDEIDEPLVVRYNWANNPIGNLFNSEGLPASPFRTDRPR